MNDRDVSITERDIFLACCGEDDEGQSKAIVNIRMADMDTDRDEEISTLDEIVTQTPIVNIYRTKGMTMVDLTFQTVTGFDFVNLVGRLNHFMRAEFEPLDESILRAVIVTLTPTEEYVEYYATGMYGTWFLMPSVPG